MVSLTYVSGSGLEWFSVTYEMSEEANYEKTKFIARWKKRLGPFTDDYWDYNYCKPLQVLYPSRLEARKIFENDANVSIINIIVRYTL
jgi:hypothetical protein